jgi:hypothetical protein
MESKRVDATRKVTREVTYDCIDELIHIDILSTLVFLHLADT